MSQIYPDSQVKTLVFYSSAEKKIYDLCKSLGSSWTIFYSVQLSHLTEQHGLEDGEMDFVFFHPGLGFIVMEVKGGRIGFDVDRDSYYSINRYHQKFDIKNPFDQALKWKARFVKYLRSQGIKAPVSHAVCFPNVYESDLPTAAHFDPITVFGDEKLLAFEKNLKMLVRHSQPEKYLKFTVDQKKMVSLLKGSAFVSKLYISDYINKNEYHLEDVEQIYDSLILPFTQSERLGIEGEAGTGKTALAIEIAKFFKNRKVLFLSSNSLLNVWVNEKIQSNHVKIETYADFAAEHNIHLLIPDKDFTGDRRDWIQLEAPSRWQDAIEEKQSKFDVVICDEAQDVQPFWWDAIEKTIQPGSGKLYIFFDSNQGIFGNDEVGFEPENVLPVPKPFFPLVNNYRTTQEIGEFSQTFRKPSSTLKAHSVRSGYNPEIYTYENQKDAVQKLEGLISKLLDKEKLQPEDICILSARKPALSPSVLEGVQELAGYPLHFLRTSSKQDLESVKTKDAITVATIATFKGLESRVVILLNISEYKMPVTNPIMASLIYVACTRAKHLLYVFCLKGDVKESEVKKRIQALKKGKQLVIHKEEPSRYEGTVIEILDGKMGFIENANPESGYQYFIFVTENSDIQTGSKVSFKVVLKHGYAMAAQINLTT